MEEALLDDTEQIEEDTATLQKHKIDPALRRIPGPCGFCGGISDDYR